MRVFTLFIFWLAAQPLFGLECGLESDVQYYQTYPLHLPYESNLAFNNPAKLLSDDTNGVIVRCGETDLEMNRAVVILNQDITLDGFAFSVNPEIQGTVPLKDFIFRARNHFGQEYVYQGHFEAGETTVKVSLNTNITAFIWSIETLSVYADSPMDKAALVSLHGLKLYYNQETYRINNREQVEKSIQAKLLQSQTEWFDKHNLYLRKYMIRKDPDTYFRNWVSKGIDVDGIYCVRSAGVFRIDIELKRSLKNEREGILLARKAGGNHVYLERTSDKIELHLADGIKIGDWKLDSTGGFWVKIGNGNWKQTDWTYINFEGTDFTEISSMGDAN